MGIWESNKPVAMVMRLFFRLMFLIPQRSSREAPEGEDLDAPRGHLHQRLPVRACQSRVSGCGFNLGSSELVGGACCFGQRFETLEFPHVGRRCSGREKQILQLFLHSS